MTDPEPNMELRALIAVLLSLAVMVAFQYFYSPATPAPAPEGGGDRAVSDEGETPGRDGSHTAGSEAPPADTGPASAGDVEGDEAAGAPGATEAEADDAVAFGDPDIAAAGAVAAEREEDLVVDTGRLRATFTNRGGRMRSAILNNYEADEGGPLELVVQAFAAADVMPFDLHVPGDRDLEERLNGALYAVDVTGGRREADAYRLTGLEPLRVRFTWSDGEGTRVVKEFGFNETEELGSVRVLVQTPDDEPTYLALGPGLVEGAGASASRYLSAGAILLRQDEVEHWAEDDLEEAQLLEGRTTWAGQESNYFLSLVIPDELTRIRMFRVSAPAPSAGSPAGGGESRRRSGDSAAGAATEADTEEEPEEELHQVRLAFAVPAAGLQAPLYVGPKDYYRLGELGHDLHRAVDFGFFAFLAIPLYKALLWTQDYVVNYGLAIILLTVVLKLLFLPLTHKSYVSMQKMRELQPQLAAIKRKYKDSKDLEEKQKMNQEVMALYKEEGVSPIGGCLPMLLQIPVLFAFYSLLSVAIELRHAPFVLWIHDLSKHDPYYVLPIAMGVSMYAQQTMSPTGGDPTQARMMKFLPVFMTVFFLGMPSGLVLYWFVNNLLGIAQQAYIQRHALPQNEGRGEGKKAKKGRKSKRGKR